MDRTRNHAAITERVFIAVAIVLRGVGPRVVPRLSRPCLIFPSFLRTGSGIDSGRATRRQHPQQPCRPRASRPESLRLPENAVGVRAALKVK